MKRKCLLLLPKPIFPLVGGYENTHFEQIKILCSKYNVTVLVFANKKLLPQEIDFYNTHHVEFHVFQCSKIRHYCNTLLGLFFSNKPLQVAYYNFSSVKKFIVQYCSDVDIAVGVLVRTVHYLDYLPNRVLKVFFMVDSIALNYQRSQKKVKSFFWKWIYKFETKRLFQFEQEWVKKAHVSFLFNKNETEFFGGGIFRVICLPHGIKKELLTYHTYNPLYQSCVAFIGKMDYQPNIDAVLWYVENVHSKIGEKYPFIIVGACPTPAVYELSKKYPHITVTGFVEDPYEILNSCLCCVVPMQTGGGIQNKLLETMALGQINIVSSLAANPIMGGRHNTHFIVADTAIEFAHAIEQIATHRSHFTPIGEQAKALISTTYSWQAFSKVYLKNIDSAYTTLKA